MNIFESLTAIQAEIDFIGKDKKADKLNYKYRGVDQVLNTLHPLFGKYKVIAVPEVLEVLHREWKTNERGTTMLYQVAKVKYTFYAEDGTNVSAIVLGEAMDSGDKASNKCMSVAYKYACFQVLSIPTEETTADPDDEQERFARPKPVTAETLKEAGVQDVEAWIAWVEEKVGKPIAMFDDADNARVWATIDKRRKNV